MSTKIDLQETLKARGSTSQIRLYDEDKPEFEELQKWLTMQLGGEAVPQAAVIHYLLEICKKSR